MVITNFRHVPKRPVQRLVGLHSVAGRTIYQKMLRLLDEQQHLPSELI